MKPAPVREDAAAAACVARPVVCGVYVQHMAALRAEVVSLSGAGDSLVAGMAAALAQGFTPVQALAQGMVGGEEEGEVGGGGIVGG